MAIDVRRRVEPAEHFSKALLAVCKLNLEPNVELKVRAESRTESRTDSRTESKRNIELNENLKNLPEADPLTTSQTLFLLSHSISSNSQPTVQA